MASKRGEARREWVALVLLVCALAGCQNKPPLLLVPVTGQVTLGGKPLPRGTVSLRPDPSRGNTSLHHPTGAIDAEGRYQVYTLGKPGAPPGTYKVVVFASEEETQGAGVHPSLPRSLIRGRYQSVATTPLGLEAVRDAPAGHYDLRLEP